jgi:hypothetical protein
MRPSAISASVIGFAALTASLGSVPNTAFARAESAARSVASGAASVALGVALAVGAREECRECEGDSEQARLWRARDKTIHLRDLPIG